MVHVDDPAEPTTYTLRLGAKNPAFIPSICTTAIAPSPA